MVRVEVEIETKSQLNSYDLEYDLQSIIFRCSIYDFSLWSVFLSFLWASQRSVMVWIWFYVIQQLITQKINKIKLIDIRIPDELHALWIYVCMIQCQVQKPSQICVHICDCVRERNIAELIDNFKYNSFIHFISTVHFKPIT